MTSFNRRLAWVLVPTLFALVSAVAQDALRIGAAKVDITPASDAANPPTGKYEHEHLYVRAIVLDNGSSRAALIGADQAGLPEPVWQAASKQIAAELNCPVENVVMSATHPHSGWGAGQPVFRGGGPAAAPGAQVRLKQRYIGLVLLSVLTVLVSRLSRV